MSSADDLVDRGVERVHVLRGAGCFGDPVERVLDALRPLDRRLQ